MAYIVMAYIFMADILMADIVMADTVVVRSGPLGGLLVMACIVMEYIVMVRSRSISTSGTATSDSGEITSRRQMPLKVRTATPMLDHPAITFFLLAVEWYRSEGT